MVDPVLTAILAEQAEDRKMMDNVRMANTIAPHGSIGESIAWFMVGVRRSHRPEPKVPAVSGKPGRQSHA